MRRVPGVLDDPEDGISFGCPEYMVAPADGEPRPTGRARRPFRGARCDGRSTARRRSWAFRGPPFTGSYTVPGGVPDGDDAAELMTPAEVASMFHVDPKTVTRWAQAGKLTYMRTLGGHRRYRRGEVVELLRESSKDV